MGPTFSPIRLSNVNTIPGIFMIQLFLFGVNTGHGWITDHFRIFKSVFDWRSSDNELPVMVTSLCLWAWNDPWGTTVTWKTAPSKWYFAIVPQSCCIYPPHQFHHHTSWSHLCVLNFIALINNLHIFKRWRWHSGHGNSKGGETIDKKQENKFKKTTKKNVPVSQDEVTSFNTWIQKRQNQIWAKSRLTVNSKQP